MTGRFLFRKKIGGAKKFFVSLFCVSRRLSAWTIKLEFAQAGNENIPSI
jgi:hypothetical protein